LEPGLATALHPLYTVLDYFVNRVRT